VNVPSGKRVSRIITDFAASQAVSTLTVLMPWTDFTSYDALLFSVVNLSSAETLTVAFDTSPDGVSPDADRAATVTVGPLKSGSIEVGPGLLRTKWRISANTQSPFNAAQVQWQVLGHPKLY
jgi:hypothetical protein